MNTCSVRLTILAILTALLAAAQRRPIDPAELARLREEEPRRLRFIAESLSTARLRLGLAEPHALELRHAFTDQYGRLHARYRQMYKGLRVLSGGLIAHLDEQDRFLDPTMKLFTGIDLDPAAVIDASVARSTVSAKLQEESPGAGPSVKLELVVYPERVLRFVEDVTLRVIPTVPSIGEYQWTIWKYSLVYLVLTSTDDSAEDDREPQAWMLDAVSGEIRRRYSLRADDSPRSASRGTARTLFFGAVDLATSRNDESQQYELTDVTRGNNTVRNLKHLTSIKRSKASPYTSGSNTWGDGRRYASINGATSSNGETPAADVAFTVERAWDLLRNVFGHDGLDGKGASIETRVHFGNNSSDAFWHRTARAAFFGDGDLAASPPPMDLETVAHEIGHGLWYSFIDSEGGDESEADGISQGNADIFASLVEFYYLASKGRGTLITDVEAAWNFRDRMVNPPSVSFRPAGGSPQPGLAYWTPNVPAQEEHAVGALYGHLFVLLARGASSIPLSPLSSRFFEKGSAGLGVQGAAELWYVATTAYLSDEPNFFDLRNAYLQAASVLHGEGSTAYNIVLNAFAAVGLGAPAVDASYPVLSDPTIQSIDEGEGSMLVATGASDDTGVLRVEFVIDNNAPALTRSRVPYSGYLDISRFAAGAHSFTARAIDYRGNVGFNSVPFALRGVNQVISDGGFESGGARWTSSAGVIRTGAQEAFLGTRYAGFDGGGFLSQSFSIGAAATEANFSFRLRVDNPDGSPSGGRLELQVRDDKGAILEILNSYFDNLSTQDALANHYQKFTFRLNAYRGRAIEMRFVSTATPGAVRFRVDNVSLTTVEPSGVEVSAEVDDGEGSLILRLRNLTGIRASQISRVDYRVNGELFASAKTDPFTLVLTTQGLIRRAHTLTAVLYDPVGTKLFESLPVTFQVREVNQIVQNGGFEFGGQNWVTTGQTSFGRDTETLQRAFLGVRYALLGGKGAAHTDELSQTFTVPDEATSVTLSFRLRIDTQERTAADILTVRLFDEVGRRLADLATYDSLLNTKGADSAREYVKGSFDLTPQVGRQVVVHFQGRENTGAPTSFQIDNVNVTWR